MVEFTIAFQANHFFKFKFSMDLDSLQWALLGSFLVGFFLIAFGSKKIDSLLAAFLTAISCWLLVGLRYFISKKPFDTDHFYHLLGDTTNIVLFLIFALLIVEIVRMHNGFDKLTALFKQVATQKIENQLSFHHLLWVVTLTSFFLAAIIDNVTAAIIITVAVSKVVQEKKDLFFLSFFGGAVGANAGGTFSPIGEITTTQLWSGGQITFTQAILQLFIPSLISIIVPLTIYTLFKKNRYIPIYVQSDAPTHEVPLRHTQIVIITALFALLIIVILKGVFGLPPMIGALVAFCMLWIVVIGLHVDKHKGIFSNEDVKHIFSKIEWETPLFFLGILLAVSALKEQHILQQLGTQTQLTLQHVPLYQPLMTFIIGLVSAVMDNVALVATVQGMYPMSMPGFESNNLFWFLLSFCAGTGGSLLVVGSAAGVAVRNKLESSFGACEWHLNRWFIQNVTPWAAIHYVIGFFVCLLK